MPRFNATPPNGDHRRELQERAREAAKPAAAEEKGRWPFPVASQDDDRKDINNGKPSPGGEEQVE